MIGMRKKASKPTSAETSAFSLAVRATASAARGASRSKTSPSGRNEMVKAMNAPLAPSSPALPASNFLTSPPTCEPGVWTGLSSA